MPALSPTPPPVTLNAPAIPAITSDELAPQARQGLRHWLWVGMTLLAVVGTVAAVVAVISRFGVSASKLSAFVSSAQPLQDPRKLEDGVMHLLAPPPAPPPDLLAASKAEPSEDKPTIRRHGHVAIPGGVLVFPKSFVPKGKEYDLVIHFHGDVKIVKESVEYAGIDAALAVVNWGIRSDAYRVPYTKSGAYQKLLKRIDTGLRARGLKQSELKRVALISFSAGYGALESILRSRLAVEDDPIDAIIALDGIHAGFVDRQSKRIYAPSVRTFVRAAQAAARGRWMMSLTHSEIVPGDYAGTGRTQRFLLDQLGIGVRKKPMLTVPPPLDLPAARRAAKRKLPMIPMADYRAGQLRVRGFKGNSASDHAAHLTQMASLVLSDLSERWREPFWNHTNAALVPPAAVAKTGVARKGTSARKVIRTKTITLKAAKRNRLRRSGRLRHTVAKRAPDPALDPAPSRPLTGTSAAKVAHFSPL